MKRRVTLDFAEGRKFFDQYCKYLEDQGYERKRAEKMVKAAYPVAERIARHTGGSVDYYAALAVVDLQARQYKVKMRNLGNKKKFNKPVTVGSKCIEAFATYRGVYTLNTFLEDKSEGDEAGDPAKDLGLSIIEMEEDDEEIKFPPIKVVRGRIVSGGNYRVTFDAPSKFRNYQIVTYRRLQRWWTEAGKK